MTGAAVARRRPGRRVRLRLLAGSAAALVLVAAGSATAGVLGPAALAGAAGGPTRLPVGHRAPIPPGSTAVGPLAVTAPLHLDVVLQPRDPAALQQFVAAVSDPASPQYGRYLAKGEFAGRFGPTPATVAAVGAALGRAGLRVGTLSTDGLLLPVSGTAGRVSAALQVHLERYRLRSGRTGFANTSAPSLPSSVAPSVAGIAGLADLVRAVPQIARPRRPATGTAPATAPSAPAAAPSATPAATPSATGPAACSTATTVASRNHAYTWTQIASTYGFTAAYGAGDLGKGLTVALFELAQYPATDVSTFESCFTLGTGEAYGSVTAVPVDGGAKATTAGQVEDVLDIEDVLGFAPEATVLVYTAPNTTPGLLDEYQKIASDDRASVISTSWGECELEEHSTVATAENLIFEQAAAQGQTVFAAAGDSGSTDCYPATPTFKTYATRLAVDDPASQPDVTGVGGTSLTTAAATDPTESVWHHGRGAGGGGVSYWWAKPAWQTTGRGSVPAPPSVTTTRCTVSPTSAATSTACRQVPDVAATADPTHGDVIYCKGATAGITPTNSSYCSTGWVPIGGTSAAAPLWAALGTLTMQSCGGTRLGLVNPRLYTLGRTKQGTDFHDITTGTNATSSRATGTGKYAAGPGYDNASGWGTPKVPALLSALCPTPVQSATASLSTHRVGATGVTYTVTFKTPAAGALAPGDAVSVVAPAGTVLPSSAGDYALTAGRGSVPVTTVAMPRTGSNNEATLMLGTAIAATATVTLTVTTVTNATTAGNQFLTVRTTVDMAGAAASFTLGAGTPSASRSTISAPSTEQAGQAATVTVTVRDAFGNPVPGQTVTLAASPGASVTGSPGTTSPTGVVSFAVAATQDETVTLTASITTFTLKTAIDVVSSVQRLVVSPTALRSGVAATLTLTFTTSAYGSLSGTATVTVVGSSGVGTIGWPATGHYHATHVGSVTKSGTGTASSPLLLTLHTASIGASSPVVIDVTAVDPGLAGPFTLTVSTSADTSPARSNTVTVTAGAPTPAKSSVTASPTTPTVGTPVAVTVTAKDTSGNPVASRNVTFHAAGTGASVSPSSTTTSATGTAQFTLTDTAAASVAVSATVTTVTLTGPTVTFSYAATGYDLVGSDGGVFVFNPPGLQGGFYGSLPGIGVVPVKPVVGMVPTVHDTGYFLVAQDGGVFSFGTAPFLGSLPGIGVTPAQPIVGIVATGTDTGYFLVGRDGGVYAFGAAPFLGSLPGEGLAVDDVIGIAATPTGSGYWVVRATGTVYAFGSARAFSSVPTTSPVTAIAGTPTGNGYWLVTQGGGVYPYGTATKKGAGTLPAIGVRPALPVIGIVPTAGAAGYWLLGSDGGIFAFTAPFYGSLPSVGVQVSDIVAAVPN